MTRSRQTPPTPTPPPSSSSSFIIPELRLDRSFSADALSSPNTDEEYDEDDEDDEDDDDYDEEDDSDDAYPERRDSKRRSMVEGSACEKHGGRLSVQNSLRRRTHSEGSLLQDPRSTCFTSDNTINCLDASHGHKGGWSLPSPKTLKKELTKNGGSMHQLCMLFSGRKRTQLRLQKHLAQDTTECTTPNHWPNGWLYSGCLGQSEGTKGHRGSVSCGTLELDASSGTLNG
uniref:Uncharacterized protein n=1 Tax=Oncorhynchus kisutch TaxID=8019 RepID=A0A8C7IM00_ONCKI